MKLNRLIACFCVMIPILTLADTEPYHTEAGPPVSEVDNNNNVLYWLFEKTLLLGGLPGHLIPKDAPADLVPNTTHPSKELLNRRWVNGRIYEYKRFYSNDCNCTKSGWVQIYAK
jgi:hypothetical protein